MPYVTESFVIDCPRHEVWEFLVDVRNTPRWNPMFVSQELVGADRIAPGATIRSVATVAGRRLVADSVVTAIDAPGRSTLRGDRPFTYVADCLLAEVEGGTLFTWHMRAERGLGGVFGPVADRVVVAVARRQLRRAGRRLRRFLEPVGVAART